MNMSIASAMSRALEQTRAGNPAEAMKTIKQALSGQPETSARNADPTEPAPPRSGRMPLGSVIDSLVSRKRATKSLRRLPGIAPEVPGSGQYERRRHSSAHGSRDYTLYVPSGGGAKIRGLVVMLHGCTQDADDFATGTRMNLHAERNDLVIVYPEQERSANQLGCWNWFQPQDQARGRGEPALLADLAQTTAAEFGVDRGRIFAAGLSAGGAMAAILGDTYSDVFAAVGVHSGLAPGTARDVISAHAAMRGQGRGGQGSAGPGSAGQGDAGQAPVPIIVFHGSNDATVHPSNAEGVLAAAIGTAPGATGEPGHDPACIVHRDGTGRILAENWTIEGLGHAWSGGSPAGSHTQPGGVDASAEMIRFFLAAAKEQRT